MQTSVVNFLWRVSMNDPSANDNKEERSRGSGNYELTEADIKFLKAVNVIVQKNTAFGIEPKSVNSLSKMLFGDRSIIAKIKSSQRGVSKNQLKIFAGFYNLEPDWFNSRGFNFTYDPKDYTSYSPVEKKKKNKAKGNTVINVNGKGASGGTVYSGDILGDITQHIHSAEKIINQVPPDLKAQVNQVFQSIHEKAEEIKKISDGYESQVKVLTQQVEALINSEKTAKENERLARESERLALQHAMKAKESELEAMKKLIEYQAIINKKDS